MAPNPKTATLVAVLTAVGSVLSGMYQLAQLRQQENKSDALVLSVMNAQSAQIEDLQREVTLLKARCESKESLVQLRMKAKPETDPDGIGDDVSMAEPVIMRMPLPKAKPQLDFAKLRENAAQGKVWRDGQFVAY